MSTERNEEHMSTRKKTNSRAPQFRPTYGPGTWLRLEAGFYAIPVPVLVGDITELADTAPESLGFRRMKTTAGPGNIGRTEKIMLDLSSRYDADFYRTGSPSEPGNIIFGARFDESHPEKWWSAMHERGSVIVILGPTQIIMKDLPKTQADFIARINTMWLADVPLMIKAWPDGIGTHPAEKIRS
ncbi:hypothetical protein [Subtercola sp. RTI3]|uniref:hypothetical protein n=1 Tax=Subtercola sp. RTI3 TaxID=3048639 RepID=UPI002B22E7E5|nr:hypothetical protein [Subtercola sp. RTI3]MEA9986076.1 hypothetical protein [Subtercola sp. RTI3]